MISTTNRIFLYSLATLLLSTPLVDSQEAPPPPPTKSTSNMRHAMQWKRFDYTCAAGAKLTVYLHDQTVKVRYKDNDYLMRQVPSADGGRYSDGKVVWWNVGNGGFLQEDSQNGDGAMIVKDCKLNKPAGSETSANTVSGTVSYRVRIAMPPNAVILVQLQDVSLADAPSKLIAEQKITFDDRQVPVPFSITFDPAKIEQNHTYSVSARILVEGELRFISDQSYPVITRGNPMQVSVALKQVTPAAPVKP